MSYLQTVAPNLAATDLAGACLRFVQRVFHNLNPDYHRSAWIAWQHAIHKSYDRNFPDDVAVPVFFSHWGTYDDGRGQYGPDPARPYWGNWGHVVSRVPGKGYLSSPTYGEGSQWFPSIEAVERAFNAEFAGWALDVGGLNVAWPATPPATTTEPEPEPEPEWEDTVKTFAGRSDRTKPQIIGDKETPVTFLDSHGESKWGDRTLMRGPGTVVSSYITVTLEGSPGTRIALRLVRETGEGENVYEYKPARAVIDSYGRAVVMLGLATELRTGQLVRLKAQAQKGQKVTVVGFTWDGTSRPGEA